MADCTSADQIMNDNPGVDQWTAAQAATMACTAAAIDATRTGTPSGADSSWRLGKSPADYDR